MKRLKPEIARARCRDARRNVLAASALPVFVLLVIAVIFGIAWGWGS